MQKLGQKNERPVSVDQLQRMIDAHNRKVVTPKAPEKINGDRK